MWFVCCSLKVNHSIRGRFNRVESLGFKTLTRPRVDYDGFADFWLIRRIAEKFGANSSHEARLKISTSPSYLIRPQGKSKRFSTLAQVISCFKSVISVIACQYFDVSYVFCMLRCWDLYNFHEMTVMLLLNWYSLFAWLENWFRVWINRLNLFVDFCSNRCNIGFKICGYVVSLKKKICWID